MGRVLLKPQIRLELIQRQWPLSLQQSLAEHLLRTDRLAQRHYRPLKQTRQRDRHLQELNSLPVEATLEPTIFQLQNRLRRMHSMYSRKLSQRSLHRATLATLEDYLKGRIRVIPMHRSIPQRHRK